MSDCKDFEKYLRGEWYPGCAESKSEWRLKAEADFAARGVSGDSRPVKQARPKAVPVSKRKTAAPPVKGRNKTDYMRDRRAKAVKEGVCVDCYKQPAKDGQKCKPCRDRRNALESKRYLERKKAA